MSRFATATARSMSPIVMHSSRGAHVGALSSAHQCSGAVPSPLFSSSIAGALMMRGLASNGSPLHCGWNPMRCRSSSSNLPSAHPHNTPSWIKKSSSPVRPCCPTYTPRMMRRPPQRNCTLTLPDEFVEKTLFPEQDCAVHPRVPQLFLFEALHVPMTELQSPLKRTN